MTITTESAPMADELFEDARQVAAWGLIEASHSFVDTRPDGGSQPWGDEEAKLKAAQNLAWTLHSWTPVELTEEQIRELRSWARLLVREADEDEISHAPRAGLSANIAEEDTQIVEWSRSRRSLGRRVLEALGAGR